MSTWLLSIAGIVVLGVLIELLLTDSHMSKFVRAIFGSFILLVIVAPLPTFFRSGLAQVGGQFELDNEILAQINGQSAQAAAMRTQRNLANAGFPDVIVVVQHYPRTPSLQIEHIFVNAASIRNANDITVRNRIIEIVRASVGIDESRIIYHGG